MEVGETVLRHFLTLLCLNELQAFSGVHLASVSMKKHIKL